MQELIHDFKKNSAVVYRYAKDLLQEAEKHNEKQYSNFVEHFGDDLVVFPDGHEMAAAMQNMSKAQFAKLSPRQQRETQKKLGLDPWTHFQFPQDLLENDAGIGLFFEKSWLVL